MKETIILRASYFVLLDNFASDKKHNVSSWITKPYPEITPLVKLKETFIGEFDDLGE